MKKGTVTAGLLAASLGGALAIAPAASADWVAGGDFATGTLGSSGAGSKCTVRYSLQREPAAIWGSSVALNCPAWFKHQVLVLPPTGSWVIGAETTGVYASTATIPRVAGAGKRWRVCVSSSNSISPNQQCTGAAGTPADYVDNYSVTPQPAPAK